MAFSPDEKDLICGGLNTISGLFDELVDENQKETIPDFLSLDMDSQQFAALYNMLSLAHSVIVHDHTPEIDDMDVAMLEETVRVVGIAMQKKYPDLVEKQMAEAKAAGMKVYDERTGESPEDDAPKPVLH